MAAYRRTNVFQLLHQGGFSTVHDSNHDRVASRLCGPFPESYTAFKVSNEKDKALITPLKKVSFSKVLQFTIAISMV